MKDSSGKGSGHGGERARETPDVSHVTNPTVTHERSDVSISGIAKFVVGLFIFGAIVFGLMSLLYRFLDAREREAQGPRAPMAMSEQERRPPPSMPYLQEAPGDRVGNNDLSLRPPDQEFIVVRQQWKQDLEGYGTLSPGATTVRIPIKEAENLLLQKGGQALPVGSGGQPSGDVSHGIAVPAASSSGRMMEERDAGEINEH